MNSTERLDEEKIETLRTWGAGLANDPREEVRAAGKAIVLLVEEIEHLHVDLWNIRGQGSQAPQGDTDDAPVPAEHLERTLLSRIRSFVRA